MPRASWRGFLRLSLVSCPIYLSPATSRTKPIRLRQVWRPGLADEGDQSPEPERPTRVTQPSLPDLGRHDGDYDADQPQPLTRVSKVIDLEKFVPRGDLDPVYLDTPYYLYPDGPVAEETLRVIGAAMAETGVVGLGRLTLSRRERMVAVEPRGAGMALFMLRGAPAADGSRCRAAPLALAGFDALAGSVLLFRPMFRTVSSEPVSESQIPC